MLSYERAISAFKYDPESGVLTNLRDGSVAGTKWPSGRGNVTIDGKRYLRSHIIWLICTKSWPKRLIDHIDRDPSNDKFSNLRETSFTINNINSSRKDRDLPKKIYGLPSGKFIGSLQINQKKIYTPACYTVVEAQDELVDILIGMGRGDIAEVCMDLWRE